MEGKRVKKLLIAAALIGIFSNYYPAYAYRAQRQQGTSVTITRHDIRRNSVCLLYKDGQPMVINRGGQYVTVWLSEPLPTISALIGNPIQGRFTLQLTCYVGTAEELRMGFAARVMQRPICVTGPRTYQYGSYTLEERYDFGSYNDPCYMER